MTLLQADNNQPVIIDGKRKTGIGSSSNYPNGMKEAKREKQESEMVGWMVKKFGVPSLTSILEHLPMQDYKLCYQNFWRRLDNRDLVIAIFLGLVVVMSVDKCD